LMIIIFPETSCRHAMNGESKACGQLGGGHG